MPIIGEIQLPGKDWEAVLSYPANFGSMSLSNNKPDGEREIYLFVPGESSSNIYRSRSGLDMLAADGKLRVINSDGFELVAELKPGEPPHELTIALDAFPIPVPMRFSHG